MAGYGGGMDDLIVTPDMSEEEIAVAVFANFLRISDEPELFWIAKDAIQNLPPEWEYGFGEGPYAKIPFFYNKVLDKSEWTHPREQYYFDLVEQEREKLDRHRSNVSGVRASGGYDDHRGGTGGSVGGERNPYGEERRSQSFVSNMNDGYGDERHNQSFTSGRGGNRKFQDEIAEVEDFEDEQDFSGGLGGGTPRSAKRNSSFVTNPPGAAARHNDKPAFGLSNADFIDGEDYNDHRDTGGRHQPWSPDARRGAEPSDGPGSTVGRSHWQTGNRQSWSPEKYHNNEADNSVADRSQWSYTNRGRQMYDDNSGVRNSSRNPSAGRTASTPNLDHRHEGGRGNSAALYDDRGRTPEYDNRSRDATPGAINAAAAAAAAPLAAVSAVTAAANRATTSALAAAAAADQITAEATERYERILAAVRQERDIALDQIAELKARHTREIAAAKDENRLIEDRLAEERRERKLVEERLTALTSESFGKVRMAEESIELRQKEALRRQRTELEEEMRDALRLAAQRHADETDSLRSEIASVKRKLDESLRESDNLKRRLSLVKEDGRSEVQLELDAARQENFNLEETIRIKTTENRRIREELSAANAQIAVLTQQVTAAAMETESAKQLVKKTSDDSSAQSAAVLQWTLRAQNLEIEVGHLKAEIDGISREKSRLEVELRRAEGLHAVASEGKNNSDAEIRRERQRLQSEASRLNSKVVEQEALVSVLRDQLDKSMTSEANLTKAHRIETDRMQSEMDRLQTRIVDLQAREEESTSRIRNAERDVLQMQEALHRKETALRTESQRVEDTKASIASIRREYENQVEEYRIKLRASDDELRAQKLKQNDVINELQREVAERVPRLVAQAIESAEQEWNKNMSTHIAAMSAAHEADVQQLQRELSELQIHAAEVDARRKLATAEERVELDRLRVHTKRQDLNIEALQEEVRTTRKTIHQLETLVSSAGLSPALANLPPLMLADSSFHSRQSGYMVPPVPPTNQSAYSMKGQPTKGSSVFGGVDCMFDRIFPQDNSVISGVATPFGGQENWHPNVQSVPPPPANRPGGIVHRAGQDVSALVDNSSVSEAANADALRYVTEQLRKVQQTLHDMDTVSNTAPIADTASLHGPDLDMLFASHRRDKAVTFTDTHGGEGSVLDLTLGTLDEDDRWVRSGALNSTRDISLVGASVASALQSTTPASVNHSLRESIDDIPPLSQTTPLDGGYYKGYWRNKYGRD